MEKIIATRTSPVRCLDGVERDIWVGIGRDWVTVGDRCTVAEFKEEWPGAEVPEPGTDVVLRHEGEDAS